MYTAVLTGCVEQLSFFNLCKIIFYFQYIIFIFWKNFRQKKSRHDVSSTFYTLEILQDCYYNFTHVLTRIHARMCCLNLIELKSLINHRQALALGP